MPMRDVVAGVEFAKCITPAEINDGSRGVNFRSAPRDGHSPPDPNAHARHVVAGVEFAKRDAPAGVTPGIRGCGAWR